MHWIIHGDKNRWGRDICVIWLGVMCTPQPVKLYLWTFNVIDEFLTVDFVLHRMKRKFYSWDECMNLREVKVRTVLCMPYIEHTLYGDRFIRARWVCCEWPGLQQQTGCLYWIKATVLIQLLGHSCLSVANLKPRLKVCAVRYLF